MVSNTTLHFAGETEVVDLNARAAFRADDNCVFLSADYSQIGTIALRQFRHSNLEDVAKLIVAVIEMRIMAHVSKDKELIAFFNSGRDIHSLVASKWKSTIQS